MELLYAFLSILLGVIILIVLISNVNSNKITKTKPINTPKIQTSTTKCICGNYNKCISKVGICDYLKYPGG